MDKMIGNSIRYSEQKEDGRTNINWVFYKGATTWDEVEMWEYPDPDSKYYGLVKRAPETLKLRAMELRDRFEKAGLL